VEPQLIVVALLVAVAAVYIARKTLRTWAGSKKGGCSGGCGCARGVERSIPERDVMIPSEQIEVRKR